jgi:hypothetical protein
VATGAGKANANDAAIRAEEQPAPAEPTAEERARALRKLADEAQAAYDGALRKVDKQEEHLDAAKASAKAAKDAAEKARRAADRTEE